MTLSQEDRDSLCALRSEGDKQANGTDTHAGRLQASQEALSQLDALFPQWVSVVTLVHISITTSTERQRLACPYLLIFIIFNVFQLRLEESEGVEDTDTLVGVANRHDLRLAVQTLLA